MRWLTILTVLIATGAGAQRYESRPNPANPEAFDRYQARVTPAGAATLIAGSVAGVAAGFNPHETAPPRSRRRSARDIQRLARSAYVGPSFTVPVLALPR